MKVTVCGLQKKKQKILTSPIQCHEINNHDKRVRRTCEFFLFALNKISSIPPTIEKGFKKQLRIALKMHPTKSDFIKTISQKQFHKNKQQQKNR